MTILGPDEIEGLGRFLRAISGAPPGTFVIAGGWAARLLRFHPLATAVEFDVVRTEDLDVAADDRVTASVSVAEALAQEGFRADLRSEDRPPLARYVLGTLELEFIAPERPTRKPRGATIEVLGASAQFVRDGNLLLFEPERIALPQLGRSASAYVVNPASFILQRLLVIPLRRTLAKRGKDTVYIHDAIITFTRGGRLATGIVEQAQRLLSTLTKSQAKRLRAQVEALRDSNDQCCREAAAQIQAAGRTRGTNADEVRLLVRLGLDELLSR